MLKQTPNGTRILAYRNLTALTTNVLATHGTRTGLLDKKRKLFAHGIGWFYMITMCVIQLAIGADFHDGSNVV